MDAGRIVAATGVGVLTNESANWVLQDGRTTGFAATASNGRCAVAIRGEPGKPDYLLYREGDGAFELVLSPALLERRWVTIASGPDGIYVWAENGVIASYDGNGWTERTSVEGRRGTFSVAGSEIFLWSQDSELLQLWDGTSWGPVAGTKRPAVVGDRDHVYISILSDSSGTKEYARLTDDGLEAVPLPPGVVTSARANGSEFAIEADQRIYRLVNGAWHKVATAALRAIDSDGTALARFNETLDLVAPSGTRTTMQLGREPRGPLVGRSRGALWTLSTSGVLMRLAGEDWTSVAGGGDHRLRHLAMSPDGELFLADDRRVYQLIGDELSQLGGDLDNLRFLGVAGGPRVYVATETSESRLEFYEWLIPGWDYQQHLDFTLAGPNEGSSRFTARQMFGLGSGTLLLDLNGVGSPTIDPVTFWSVYANDENGWEDVTGGHEYEIDGLSLTPFGPANSPGALAVMHPLVGSSAPQKYQVLDESGRIVEAGSFTRQLSTLGGRNMTNMVGTSDGDLVVREESPEWQTVTTLSDAARRSGDGWGWFGTDGVGIANAAGTTICEMDW